MYENCASANSINARYGRCVKPTHDRQNKVQRRDVGFQMHFAEGQEGEGITEANIFYRIADT